MQIRMEYDANTRIGRSLGVSFNIEARTVLYTITYNAPGKYIQYEETDFAKACEMYDNIYALADNVTSENVA